MIKNSIYERIVENLFGYDFFISYRRSDSINYVIELESMLNEKNISCFVDTKNVRFGEELPQSIKKGLKKSKKMLLIASPEAFEPNERDKGKKDWVRIEITEFSNRIIPINIDNNFEKFKLEIEKLNKTDVVFIKEDLPNLKNFSPSQNVVENILKNHTHEKISVKSSRWLIAIIVFFMVLFAIIFYFWNDSTSSKDEIIKNAIQEDSIRVSEWKEALLNFNKNEKLCHYSISTTNKIDSICKKYKQKPEWCFFLDSLNRLKK